MKILTSVSFLCALLFMASPTLAESKSENKILIELFTSQGCYSCPPAEELLRDYYSQRQDVIALEFHVDYWNDLVYGSAGAWEDPFSDVDYTRRQQSYNRHIRDTGSVFTPQMVVQGAYQGSGTARDRIDFFISEAKGHASNLEITFQGNAVEGLQANVKGTLRGDENIYYAIYWLEKTTIIPSGENKGKELVSHNIVRAFDSIEGTRRALSLPTISPLEEGCAVWVQEGSSGKILAAASCPTS